MFRAKTRPLEVCELVPYAPLFLVHFDRTISRRKTVLLGPLGLPKNMLRKRLLIGLFVLINNRTIGEPKRLQGGRERRLSTRGFLRPVSAGTGILGWVFVRPVSAATGAILTCLVCASLFDAHSLCMEFLEQKLKNEFG